MLELRILVDNIDYDSIAEYLIPVVAEKLRREDKGGILGSCLLYTSPSPRDCS